MKAIGIDIGTTSVCGVVVDVETGQIVHSCTRNSNAFLPSRNDWEKIQSVDKIITVATEILESFIQNDIVVIGVTGQMHGIVYFDANGVAVSPLYTWQDGRGNLPYKDTTYAQYLNSCSGYGNVTDFYNRMNGIRPAAAVGYCTIHDYFAMRLCGLARPLIHSSDAASFGCYHLTENRFDYDCNVDVVSDYCILGEYRKIPVSVAIGDNQASVFSTLADENNILLNVGTGSQVSVISNVPVEAENIETRPFLGGKYLVVGSALCGGRSYSLLKNFYSEILGYTGNFEDNAVYQIMEQMLAQISSTSITVDTRFAGTRSNPSQCGSILGLRPENFTPSHLTLGVLDGMVSELFEMYESMQQKRCGIIGSGNGIRMNPTLVRIFEKKFGTQMKIPKHMEEASFGAALFGLISCNVLKDASEARKLIQYTNFS